MIHVFKVHEILQLYLPFNKQPVFPAFSQGPQAISHQDQLHASLTCEAARGKVIGRDLPWSEEVRKQWKVPLRSFETTRKWMEIVSHQHLL